VTRLSGWTLEQKGFLRSRSRSQIRGDQEYAFKHELIRDVAYDMLPRAERRLLHSKVTDWMERALGERAEEYFDLLAHHAVQAGRQERAIEYLMHAAERAHRAAAYREQAALLAQALALAEQTDQHALSAELRARRGIAFSRIGMWTNARPDLETALKGLTEARVEQRIEALVELAMVCQWLFDVDSNRRYAAEALALAEASGRDDLAAGRWARSPSQTAPTASSIQSCKGTSGRSLGLGTFVPRCWRRRSR
jgi:predicted ATPase